MIKTGVLCLLLAVGATAQAADYEYEVPPPGTYQLPVVRPAADGALLDPAGRPVSLRELTRDRVTVLSFIYTRCASPKACPMATGVLMDLHELSGKDSALANNLRLVSMSFDPRHDTPARMRAYSAIAADAPTAAPWHFVTARSETELQPILAAYGQAVDQKSDPADRTGPLNHTLRVYLIDADGRIRNIYSSGTLDLRLVLADIKTLLLETNSLGEQSWQ
jgi:cytochrome oxidase Cu insertion factor (SCO1/SenC/PrrC family)